jgi:hydrogenase/urease accessory protein HupE
MQGTRQRARFRPGPPFAIALVWFALTTAVLRAHDPGLSTLDVTVNDDAIVVSLSLAAVDLAASAPGHEAAIGSRLGELARDAIRVSVDGETLRASNDVARAEEGGGARISLSFARPSSSHRAARLTITSDVPKRMARGHRELLIVNVAGRVATETLLDATSDSATVDLRLASSPMRLAWSFLVLGVGHILSGFDHLAFLAGLILAARRVRGLVVALTAFTVAHSVSLMMVVFGDVHAPASIVEPLIAASVAWIGVENLLSDRRVATKAVGKSRWSIVFGFGLIHGFGFAGTLTDLGFGSSPAEVALALVSFNAGVEAGQLATAAVLLPVVWMMRARPRLEARLLPACSVLIAIAGGWWLIERVA